ncbi:hypothetical protein AUJ84_02220 [Candidatus Pacearchaeota archaeon CG1_02_32_132]|nr:MAG: hypothetical protein AUJ84_02220 [Candidatus Pacearchaeota archaeon CG1_02_32_132]
MIDSYLAELKDVLEKVDKSKIQNLIDKVIEIREKDGTIFIIGNGGSAANASHWACDLSKGTLTDFYDPSYKRLRVVSLTDNVATLTALTNDLSFDQVFSQQLRNLIRKGDLLISITGSGKSKNILKAIELAKDLGAYVFSVLGFDGGEAIHLSDDSIVVSSRNYGIIEDVHLTIGHILTASIKKDHNYVN